LHFAAHGEQDGIALAHEDCGRVILDGEMLADLLGALAIRPKLVVLNACNSAQMAARLTGHADFVIGTDAPISNIGARSMAATLYRRLADAASVGDAFTAAASMLKLIDQDSVSAQLYPEGAMTLARRTRLTDPLRIVACFPAVDRWLEHGHTKPQRKFEPTRPDIQFGVAGAPATSRQTQLFTDDESVQPRGEESLADARSWIVETQPVRGEVWISPFFQYYGDMQWYASVTTADHRLFSAVATSAQALERYYFEEEWYGGLPEAIAIVVRDAIAQLRLNDGSKRTRQHQAKMGAVADG
jgi:hypothetical protein